VKCLVTGGSGFVGSHVVDALTAAGHETVVLGTTVRELVPGVRYVRGSVLDDDVLADAASGCDAVLHLAAVADADRLRLDPVSALRVNVEGVLRVCRAAAAAGAGRVVLAGTGWVYGAAPATEPVPLAETAPLAPDGVDHLYTASKLSAEAVLWGAARTLGLAATVLRYGNPYGPRMRQALVPARFVAQALAGRPLTVAGGGEQQRSFVYVTDLAAAHVPALGFAAVGRTVNLEGPRRHTVRELADVVAAECGSAGVEVVPGRAGDYAHRPVSTALAAELLGWRATTGLADGIHAYVGWLAGPDARAHDWG
jgi:UDP-glucose 4-epimerase